MRTLLLSLVLTLILDAVADRVSRPLLGVDASRTLWGTSAIRMIAWYIAWRFTQRVNVPSSALREAT
jgi:hypothetical protein